MRSFFISSTFRDMQAERDLIHTRIFPRLRRLAAACGENIQELDLRWGVDTADMSEEDSSRKVLSVCIDAIDRCRPYIIILLGERYGWIPGGEVVHSLRDSRVEDCYERDMSITNLEIRYGVLQASGDLSRCIFCFRDPAAVAQTDAEHRPLYDAESPLHRAKLDALKEKIRANPDAVILDYTARWDADAGCMAGLDGFAEDLAAMLEKMLLRDLAGQEAPIPVDRRIGEMARMQEEYLSAYVNRYPEECRVLSRLYGAAVRRIAPPSYWQKNGCCIMIRGGAGTGKSAMMAWIARTLEENGYPTVLYFAGAAGGQGSYALLSLAARRLEQILGQDHRETDPGNIHARLRELARAAGDRRIFCCIDALDQLFSGDEGYLDLMELCPDFVYVVSCLPSFRLAQAAPEYHRDITAVDMEPLLFPQREDIIVSSALRRGKQVDRAVAARTAEAAGAGNPLYLSMVLQRFFMMDRTDFEAAEGLAPGMAGLHAFMEELLARMPAEPEAMAAYLLDILSDRFDAVCFPETLRLIALSREGLTEKELETLLALDGLEFVPVLFQQTVSYLYDAFTLRADGRWAFRHRLFGEAVCARTSPAEREHIRDLFARYALEDDAFLAREGYICLLERRHPGAVRIPGSAADWPTLEEVRDRIAALAEDPSFRTWMTGLVRGNMTEKAAAFWQNFREEYYGDGLRTLCREVLESALEDGTLSAAVRGDMALALAESTPEGLSEEMRLARCRRLYREAEACFGEAEEPRRSVGLATAAAWLLFDLSWREECREEALSLLPNAIARAEEAAVQTAAAPGDGFIRAVAARRCLARARARLGDADAVPLLEACLRDLEAADGEVGEEKLLAARCRILSDLVLTAGNREPVDPEELNRFAQQALDETARLAERYPTPGHLEIRITLLQRYAAFLIPSYRYPYLKACVDCARLAFGACPTDYWRSREIETGSAYAVAAFTAIMERNARYPANMLEEARAIWDHSCAEADACLPRGLPGDTLDRHASCAIDLAEYLCKQGHLTDAETNALRAVRLLENRLESSREDVPLRLWIERRICAAHNILAAVYNEMLRCEDAARHAAIAGERAAQRRPNGKILSLPQSVDAAHGLAVALYRLRRDGEALAACDRVDALLADAERPLSEAWQDIDAYTAYIRARLFLEKGELAAAEEAFRRCTGRWGDSGSKGYGRMLVLMADLIEARGGNALPTWKNAASYWERQEMDHRKRFEKNISFRVTYDKDSIIRRRVNRESGEPLLAAYFLAYCHYRCPGIEAFPDASAHALFASLPGENLARIRPEELRAMTPADRLAADREGCARWEERRRELEAAYPRSHTDPGQLAALLAGYAAEDVLPHAFMALLDRIKAGYSLLDGWHPTAAEASGLYDLVRDLYTALEDERRAVVSATAEAGQYREIYRMDEEAYGACLLRFCRRTRFWIPTAGRQICHVYRILFRLCMPLFRCREDLPENAPTACRRLARRIFFSGVGHGHADLYTTEELRFVTDLAQEEPITDYLDRRLDQLTDRLPAVRELCLREGNGEAAKPHLDAISRVLEGWDDGEFLGAKESARSHLFHRTWLFFEALGDALHPDWYVRYLMWIEGLPSMRSTAAKLGMEETLDMYDNIFHMDRFEGAERKIAARGEDALSPEKRAWLRDFRLRYCRGQHADLLHQLRDTLLSRFRTEGK